MDLSPQANTKHQPAIHLVFKLKILEVKTNLSSIHSTTLPRFGRNPSNRYTLLCSGPSPNPDRLAAEYQLDNYLSVSFSEMEHQKNINSNDTITQMTSLVRARSVAHITDGTPRAESTSYSEEHIRELFDLSIFELKQRLMATGVYKFGRGRVGMISNLLSISKETVKAAIEKTQEVERVDLTRDGFGPLNFQFNVEKTQRHAQRIREDVECFEMSQTSRNPRRKDVGTTGFPHSPSHESLPRVRGVHSNEYQPSRLQSGPFLKTGTFIIDERIDMDSPSERLQHAVVGEILSRQKSQSTTVQTWISASAQKRSSSTFEFRFQDKHFVRLSTHRDRTPRAMHAHAKQCMMRFNHLPCAWIMLLLIKSQRVFVVVQSCIVGGQRWLNGIFWDMVDAVFVGFAERYNYAHSGRRTIVEQVFHRFKSQDTLISSGPNIGGRNIQERQRNADGHV
ncbi:hypothetical protein PROFUN_15185 [Planoprotostelium fungivorum]|uniref:Uncharacterized protein n=1 Tax=Planoprotostelium fungivorum TaxID=1890364 RepID=A0A2P6MVY7_9EUKA|nr:hypothetical protein PROFUN_15185 [Planoprotostelium fungivorum]